MEFFGNAAGRTICKLLLGTPARHPHPPPPYLQPLPAPPAHPAAIDGGGGKERRGHVTPQRFWPAAALVFCWVVLLLVPAPRAAQLTGATLWTAAALRLNGSHALRLVFCAVPLRPALNTGGRYSACCYRCAALRGTGTVQKEESISC